MTAFHAGTGSSAVERLVYTELVGGSIPSPCTTLVPEKTQGIGPVAIAMNVYNYWTGEVINASIIGACIIIGARIIAKAIAKR